MRKIWVLVGSLFLLLWACNSITGTDDPRPVPEAFQSIDIPIITTLE